MQRGLNELNSMVRNSFHGRKKRCIGGVLFLSDIVWEKYPID
jgi:hypothetical protein